MAAVVEEQIAELQQKICELTEGDDKNVAAAYAKSLADRKSIDLSSVSMRRSLKGHYNKVYDIHWAPDSRHVVSASQDGKLIIWNAFTGAKDYAFTLPSSWVMCCAYGNTSGVVASGGLDNQVSIYRMPVFEPDEGPTAAAMAQSQHPTQVLDEHDGYVSCVRFMGIDDTTLVSSSGDGSVIVWDVPTQQLKSISPDHGADVMSLSVMSHTDSVYVSGGCDHRARLWDTRVAANGGLVKTFMGHDADINSVSAALDGTVFVSGSEDGSCKLWDVRAAKPLNTYINGDSTSGVTSVAFSGSNGVFFTGCDDFSVNGWDTMSGERLWQSHVHDNRVSSLDMAPDGEALCTGSWDYSLKVFA